jgi:heme A synthase
VAIAVITVAARLFAARVLRVPAALLIAVVIAQICLGAATVWSAKQPVITSLHVMTGAATLALSVITALAASRFEREAVRTLIASEVPV